MSRLPTKTSSCNFFSFLLSPSLSRKLGIEWNLSLVKTVPKVGVILGPVFGVPESFHAALDY